MVETVKGIECRVTKPDDSRTCTAGDSRYGVACIYSPAVTAASAGVAPGREDRSTGQGTNNSASSAWEVRIAEPSLQARFRLGGEVAP